MKQPSIVILIPYGVQTGGPEALHQLAHAINESGGDAKIWYTIDSDLITLKELSSNGKLNHGHFLSIPHRTNIISGYEKYKPIPVSSLHLTEDTCIIYPETFLEWKNYLKHTRALIWWLSVDNAFTNLSNRITNINNIRHNHILYGYQSTYAKNFLSALGMRNTLPLTDYVDVAAFSIRPTTKCAIAINAGPKVSLDVDEIADRIHQRHNIEVIKIRGMSPDQVKNSFARSYLYIDLGSFPGKDRLPREAIMFDCCPCVLDVGAARDFNLPEDFYINLDRFWSVLEVCESVLANPEHARTSMANAKALVMHQRSTFFDQVHVLLDRLKFS